MAFGPAEADLPPDVEQGVQIGPARVERHFLDARVGLVKGWRRIGLVPEHAEANRTAEQDALHVGVAVPFDELLVDVLKKAHGVGEAHT